MKITGSQIGPVNQVQLDTIQKAKAKPEVPKALAADQVVLSADVSAVDAARKVIAEVPDVRADKVEAIRQEIQDGRYNVPADKIAEKVLAELQLARLHQK